MSPKFKGVIILLVVAMLGGIMIGSSVTGAERIKLVAMNVNRGTADKMFEEEFEKAYPNIDLELQTKPFPDIFQHIQVAMQAGGPTPDVIIVDSPVLSAYAYRNWLMPLDNVLDPKVIKDVDPIFLEQCKYKGKIYAFPITVATSMWFYNKDMFDAAGLEYYPEPPASPTWEEVLENAKKLVKKNASGAVEVWGMQIDQEDRPYEMLNLIGSNGGKYIADDHLTVKGIIDSDIWVKTFQWYVDLYRKWNVSCNTLG